MIMDKRYSFIIPVKYINDYIQEAIAEILKINRYDYEILIFRKDKLDLKSLPI